MKTLDPVVWAPTQVPPPVAMAPGRKLAVIVGVLSGLSGKKTKRKEERKYNENPEIRPSTADGGAILSGATFSGLASSRVCPRGRGR